MTDVPPLQPYRASIAQKLLTGILPIIFSLLFTDVSIPFRLFIGLSGAVNLLEVGQRLLSTRRILLAHVLVWLSWGCFFAGIVAGMVALYQVISG
jgi:hypothetical protein